MADTNIDVRITGNASGAKDASAQAAQAFDSAFAQMRGTMSGMSGPFGQLGGWFSGLSSGAKEHSGAAAEGVRAGTEAMKGHLESLGAPFEFVRQHFAALGAILAGGGAFKEAIGTTRELSGEAVKLAKAAGISTEEASGLNVALKTVGSDADSYTGALTKLTRQLRTNEQSLNAMGIATRDSNGAFLDGRALMDSTIETLNTYKEGTDRNLAAQVAFSRGAEESARLLKLSQEVQEEGKKKAEELNLVIGPETVAATREYRLAMTGMKEVGEGMANTLGQAVMPVLTDLAKWFNASGPSSIATFKPIAAGIGDTLRIVVDVVKELWTAFRQTFSDVSDLLGMVSGNTLTFGQFVSNCFAVIGIALLAVKEAFQLAFEGIRSALAVAIEYVRMWASVVDAALTQRNWAAVKAAYAAGMADVEQAVQASADRIVKIREEAAAKMERLASGGGYDRDEGKPDGGGAKAKGTRSFVEPKEKKGADTIMAQYEAELAAKKQAIAEQNAVDGTFYEMSKAAEAAFWQSKIGTVEAGSKAQLQIQRKYSELKVAENKQEFEATIGDLDKQIAAARFNYDEKIALAEKELTLTRQAYGERSKEVEAGERKIVQLRQQQSDQLLKLDEVKVQSTQQAGLAQIALEEQHAQLMLQLGTMTQAQFIAAQIGFENRRYAIEVEGLRARAALQDTHNDPVAMAKVNMQLEQQEQQHQQRMSQIMGQAAMQQTQLQRSLMTSLQGSFQNLVNGMMTGTLRVRDFMRQAWQSIAGALSSAVTQMVADWVKGELMKKAATSETAMAQIQAAAAVAAGNAYDAIVGIPYVGPFLAPAAAAVAYAGVMAFGASASAEGGYDIPAGVNPVVQTHAKEMILPEKHADVIRSMADGGGGASGGGGDTHLHVHAVDAKSVERLFKDNGQHLVAALDAQRRSFNSPRR